jgi:hypothetical protein
MTLYPPSGSFEREKLRQKGQFWTPHWITEPMVTYVLQNRAEILFDPAVGAGAFFSTAKQLQRKLGYVPKFVGREIDANALFQAQLNGISVEELANVSLQDFILDPPQNRFSAIVANPPYIRHHRLPAEYKSYLKQLSLRLVGKTLDGRSGLHVYFLIQSLSLLEAGGHLAFILPADTFEGVFASTLWNWIAKQFCLDAVVNFTGDASPFPGIDTNPVIVLIKNSRPQRTFWWVQCHQNETSQLQHWVENNFENINYPDLTIHLRDVAEALNTGFSRPPRQWSNAPTLGNYASVMRGVATGANEFFFLTKQQIQRYQLPPELFLPAIGRTRDVQTSMLDDQVLADLEAKGRPTWLFSPDARPLDQYPPAARKYFEMGIEMGIHKRTLIATRKPWYKMEVRSIPPFLFAYLGRRNSRFIRNAAGVIPLTSFLCVYPNELNTPRIDAFWQMLNDPCIEENLRLVGKSYGDGAIKVEPRGLEQLPIPEDVIKRYGLISSRLF